jgi:integrase/recombinase XerD
MRQLLAVPDIRSPYGLRDRAVLELLYGTGMRLGELLSLELGDLDLERGLVHIRDGKGGRDRVVPTGTAARRWLEDYLAQARPQWTQGRRGKNLHIFMTSRGTALRTTNVHAMLCSYCQKARIPKIYPHAIRHAVATQMLARGADLRAIKRLLGHRRLVTTQLYTRVVPTEVKATHARTHPREAEP